MDDGRTKKIQDETSITHGILRYGEMGRSKGRFFEANEAMGNMVLWRDILNTWVSAELAGNAD